MDNFVVFILSHGRPNNVYTYKSLIKQGYTGKIIIIIDNEDPTASKYLKKYENVEIFDKYEISKKFDQADNFNDRRTIVYARNACFEIAEKLGYEYFLQLDDDYTGFEYRLYSNGSQKPILAKNLDEVFKAYLDFYINTPFDSIAFAQGGDFIGGKLNQNATNPTIKRKCMNSFFCSVKRKFNFIGRINEDVNTYTYGQSVGLLLGTIPFFALVQKTTQKNKGGMTDVYLSSGTYVKSFYTVIFAPSCCKIKPMGDTNYRLHHNIDWKYTAPKIISEDFKK